MPFLLLPRCLEHFSEGQGQAPKGGVEMRPWIQLCATDAACVPTSLSHLRKGGGGALPALAHGRHGAASRWLKGCAPESWASSALPFGS